MKGQWTPILEMEIEFEIVQVNLNGMVWIFYHFFHPTGPKLGFIKLMKSRKFFHGEHGDILNKGL